MRAMKDSGIPWIGKIPEGWNIDRLQVALQEIVEKNSPIKTDYILSLTNNRGVIPYTDKGDVGNKSKDNLEEYKVAYPNTIVANSMNILIGSVGICDYYGCVSPVYYVFQATEKGSLRFFNYIMSSEPFQKHLRQYANGILEIRLRLSSSNILKRYVPFPSLAEQQRIAEFLDMKCAEVDEMIALQEQIIEELKAYKQSVITEAVTKGLNPATPMKDSGIKWIRQIPYHWNIVAPKALFSQRKEKATEGQRQLTSSQQYGIIYQDEYCEITGNKVVAVIKDFDILKQVQAGDFVISMRSFQGGLEYSTKSGSISSAYVMLIPNLNYVYPRFYRWLFKSICYINALQSTSNMVRDGQAMRFSNFAQVPLYQVPLKEQESIADYLDEKCADIDSLIQTKQSKIDSLKEYKKSIIYEYVTGKREVE